VRINYKGHEIDVSREKCMDGWSTLYFSVFTDEGKECLTSFENSAETVRDKVAQLKERIDNELASDDPWCFREEEGND